MSVDALASLLRERRPCVVLTGAGVSTESGIPDFRSPTGIWADVDPMEVASIRAFTRDPERVWGFYRRRIHLLLEARPNAGHHALAELERQGVVQAVVTQNIDMLHERAGTQELVEVHGSIRTATCPDCGTCCPLAAVLAQLEADEGPPRCPSCAAVVKPDVVFFGEQLPVQAIDRAFELAERARLLLVVGSSLEVHPVAGLPHVTRDAGGLVAIVNQGPTSFDRFAALRIADDAGEVLDAALGRLSGERASRNEQGSSS
jgi:NAD-dependent deacetylase